MSKENLRNQAVSLKEGMWTIPNLLSAIRIVLVPVFLVLFLQGHYLGAAITLIVSGLTDFADGKIARHFNMISKLGKMLDPIAGKLTQITIAIAFFFGFYRSGDPALSHFSWIFWFFVVKELSMVVGAVVLLSKNFRPAAANWFGKVATFYYYVIMIALLCFAPVFGVFRKWAAMPNTVVIVMVSLSVVLTLLALISYSPAFFRSMRNGNAENSSDK